MAIKEFDIRIPKGRNDLRIKHWNALKDSSVFIDKSLESKVNFICKFCDLKLYQVRLLSQEQVETIYNHAAAAFAGFRLNDEPPKQIVLDGKKFDRIDPRNVGVGWHIDISEAAKRDAINKDPVWLASLFYYPAGEVYGSVNVHEKLLHPIADRYETFKEHLPLQTFLESNTFFLRYYVRSMRKYTVSLRAKILTEKILRFLRLSRGRNQYPSLLKSTTMETGTK